MSRITHFKQQTKSVYYWDYYILCHLNVAAALALQRMEYWDGTKDDAIVHAEALNDAQERNHQTPTQDTSHWIYKSQDELQWELMGITGEKGTAALLKFLQEDVCYLVSRHNPTVGFDRTKQYEFQADRVQLHLDYLSYILGFFKYVGCRLTPVFYAIELLTREGVYIEQLSVAHVHKKLLAMQDDQELPRFLKGELAKEKRLSSLSTSDVSPSRNFAEWKVAKLRDALPQNCGMESANLRDGIRESAGWNPQNCGSNTNNYITSNYDQSLQTIITNNEVREKESDNTTTPTQEAANAAHALASLLGIENLTEEDIALARKAIQKSRQGNSPSLEETPPSSLIQSKQQKTSKTGTRQRRSAAVTLVVSLQALAILTAWSHVVWGGTSNREVPHTKDNIEAAEEGARIGATEADLKTVRDRLLAQKDGFWRSRGVTLKNIMNNFHLAALGPVQAYDAPPTQAPAKPEEHKPRKRLARITDASQQKAEVLV